MLSEETFETLAGSAAYKRGKKVYQDGKVGDLEIDKSTVRATVQGEYNYQVTLHHTQKIFEGECSCPASNNFDFCKHCVATSLKYYYQTQTNQELADLPKEIQLLGFLNTLSKPELAKELHALIQADPERSDHWLLRAEVASGGLTASSIRKRITKAIPYKPSGLWRYRDVAEYFQRCENTLSTLQDALFRLKAADVAKLLTYIFQRREKTLETIDDSGGYRLDLEALIIGWFDQNQAQEDWTSKERSKLFAGLILDQKFSYEPLDLEKKLIEFCSLEEQKSVYLQIQKTWASLTPNSEQYSDAQYYYQRLEDCLIQQARNNKDLEAEFKILERGATNVQRCLELVELCREHKRMDEAYKWLDYASKVQQLSQHDIYDIESAKIEMLKANQQYDDAIKIEWTRFEELEEPGFLSDVLKTAKQLGTQDTWLNKGIAHLSSRIEKNKQSQRNRQRAHCLAQVYVSNALIDQAIALSHTNLLSPEMMMAIINAAPSLDKKELSLIEKCVNLYLRMTGQRVYEQAVSFLVKQQKRIAPAKEASFEKTIQSIYREPNNLRKTNFIKRLKTAFPDYF